MYQRTAYQKLDQPVLVWMGLEFREIGAAIGGGAAVAVGAGFVLGLGLVGLVLGFATGGMLVVLFRSLRSGGPGYMFAALYRAGLFELLPTGLRPRYLLPVLRGQGRQWFSPRLETEGAPDAR